MVSLNEKTLRTTKLELKAALTTVRIKNKSLDEAKFTVKRIFFRADSKTLLKYIQDKNKRFQVYVTHQKREIRKHSDIENWHYIPIKLNVADNSTSQIKFIDFESNCRYLTGPTFLHKLEFFNIYFFNPDSDTLANFNNINQEEFNSINLEKCHGNGSIQTRHFSHVTKTLFLRVFI